MCINNNKFMYFNLFFIFLFASSQSLLATKTIKSETFLFSLKTNSFHIFSYNHDNIKTIRDAKKILETKRTNLVVATNGGIFDKKFNSLGLLIENGKVIKPLNLKNGKGNFYLKPNGVFFINNSKANIFSSDEFSKLAIEPSFAIQSGPLLIQNSKINSSFLPDSKSKFIRNAIGINYKSEIILIITKEKVSLYNFAKHLKENLKCKNALYLDGGISGFYSTKYLKNIDKEFGSIIVITEINQLIN